MFIDEQTARRHLKDYSDNDKTGGSSGGSQGKLTQEQSSRLLAILATCDVPTTKTAAEKVESLFGIKSEFFDLVKDGIGNARFVERATFSRPHRDMPNLIYPGIRALFNTLTTRITKAHCLLAVQQVVGFFDAADIA